MFPKNPPIVIEHGFRTIQMPHVLRSMRSAYRRHQLIKSCRLIAKYNREKLTSALAVDLDQLAR